MRHFYLSVMRVPRNYAYFVARTGFVATIKKKLCYYVPGG